MHPLFLRLGVAATLLIEIPFTFLLIMPLRHMRRTGVVLQALLQVMSCVRVVRMCVRDCVQILIIATGNYNFFNFLTLALLVPVWECDQLKAAPGGSMGKKVAGGSTLGTAEGASSAAWGK
jgi:hypothetical protein